MTLIYAFQDSTGHWHADPDIPLLDPADEPGRGTLTYHPVPGAGTTPSPFAGQTLTVLYGCADLDPGPVTYQLDSGGRFQASWHVHTLLAAPVGTSVLPEDIPARPVPTSCLDTAYTENGRRYRLTATRTDDERLALEFTVSTAEGEIQGELGGTLAAADIGPLARLLDPASRTLTGTTSPTGQPPCGTVWTQDSSARLAARYRQQRDFGILAGEFGCSRNAIYEELKRLELISAPRRSPAAPQAPKTATVSPILQQRRLVHRNSHARWSTEEEQQLARRCAQGATATELSEEFGRSTQAIESRLLMVGATGPAADQARSNLL
jgi:hypothetical protein